MANDNYNISRVPLLAEALTPIYFQWANEWRIEELAVQAVATPLETMTVADMVVSDLRDLRMAAYLGDFATRTRFEKMDIFYLDHINASGFFSRVRSKFYANTIVIRQQLAQMRQGSEIRAAAHGLAEDIRVASLHLQNINSIDDPREDKLDVACNIAALPLLATFGGVALSITAHAKHASLEV